jgi:DHA1 family bicyclomycin/chloramphenicol resistance-like MFS transporter
MGKYPADRSPPPRRAPRVALLLGLCAGLGPFTIDSYLPALPALAADLDTTDASAQLTLAATMLGFAVGQLVMGPWSDRVGRRLPLVLGLSLLIISTVGAMLSADVVALMVARALQGVGAASAAVVAVATARDLFAGRALAGALSGVAIVQSLAPLVAPVVGSLQLVLVGWRGIFALLALYAVVVVILVVPRLPHHTHQTRSKDPVLTRYRRLFADPLLRSLLLLAGLRFTALYTFLQWSPFLLQQERGLSAFAFGVAFAVVTLGMMAGLQLSPRAMRRGTPPARVLWASYGVLFLGAALTALPIAGSVWIVVSGIVFMLGCGLGLPTIQVMALAPHEKDAATVAGLIGATGFGAASALAPALNLLPAALGRYDLSLAAVIGAVALVSALVSIRPLARTGHRPL